MVEKEKPLYDQLMTTLKNQIDTQMMPHDKMMSERELALVYNISRTTVRSALKQLEIEGYIYKQHGKGTFVSGFKDRLANLSKMYSFTEQMLEMGKIPSTRVLNFSIEVLDEAIATQMDMLPGERAYRIERLRLADNEPFMWEVSYLPVKLFPELTREMIEQRPLYSVLNEDYHQIIRLANEQFFAGVVSGEHADILKVSNYSAVFNIVRHTYNNQNILIEYTQSVARGDKFRYQIHHTRGTV